MSEYSLENYVDVAERIEKFYERYPDGRLVRDGDWRVTTVEAVTENGEAIKRTFIVYHALAYRDPDDKHPGPGSAWEPFPGPTPFTKDSELMNAETAAWGRAMAAVGIETRRGIASRQEVQARQGNGDVPKRPPSEKQLGFLERLLREKKVPDQALVLHFVKETLSSTEVSGLIDRVKGDGWGSAKLVDAARDWGAKQPDVEADTEGLEQREDPDAEPVPFS
jgi:hypothetical protein